MPVFFLLQIQSSQSHHLNVDLSGRKDQLTFGEKIENAEEENAMCHF